MPRQTASPDVDEDGRAAGYVTYRKLQRQGLHLKMMYVLTLSFEDSSVVMCRIIYRSKRHLHKQGSVMSSFMKKYRICMEKTKAIHESRKGSTQGERRSRGEAWSTATWIM